MERTGRPSVTRGARAAANPVRNTAAPVPVRRRRTNTQAVAAKRRKKTITTPLPAPAATVASIQRRVNNVMTQQTQQTSRNATVPITQDEVQDEVQTPVRTRVQNVARANAVTQPPQPQETTQQVMNTQVVNAQVVNTQVANTPIVNTCLKWDQDFRALMARKTSLEFLSKCCMFPKQRHFSVTNTKDKTYYTQMKEIFSRTHTDEEMVNFDVFYYENRQFWKRSCNELRTKLLDKTKTRYFSKLLSFGSQPIASAYPRFFSCCLKVC